MKQNPYTHTEPWARISRWCAYQERSQKETRFKLYEWGVYGDKAEELISRLIQENFINEERFAKAYVGGKFRIKRWGKVKIKQGLKLHDISAYCLKEGLREIDDDDYAETLKSIAKKKWALLKGEDVKMKRYKLTQYLIARGFEPDLVNEVAALMK